MLRDGLLSKVHAQEMLRDVVRRVVYGSAALDKVEKAFDDATCHACLRGLRF